MERSGIGRLETAERVSGGAALIGILASFLSWVSYSSAGQQITVNGFRASLLGDVFVLSCFVCLLAVAVRAGLIDAHLKLHGTARVAAWVAFAAIVLQALLAVDSGDGLHKGFGLAFLSAVALAVSTKMRRRLPVSPRSVRRPGPW